MRISLDKMRTLAAMIAAVAGMFGNCRTGFASEPDRWDEPFSKQLRSVYFMALGDPTDQFVESSAAELWLPTSWMLQEVPPLQPQMMQPDTAQLPPPPAVMTTASVFRGGAPRSNLPTTASVAASRSTADTVLGIESKARASSDAGNLLGESANSRGVSTQKRNPIITDPRVRGSRVGQLAASGSYWVPARADLDTMLSKIDSRLIADANVIKGPYAVRHGPGVEFIDFELVPSPRSSSLTPGGTTVANYATNGEQWYGRQTFTLSDQNWGARVGYGHRTGSDYESGDGLGIPSSYNSRDIDVALGWDLEPGRSIEFSYLRLDQTDVELPGQAFDISALVSDAFEVTAIDETLDWTDRLEVETWYNLTQLKGDAQNPSKRTTFPFLDLIRYSGRTDVESQSTGARLAATWELDADRTLVAGTDFRLVRQELDEFSSGRFGFQVFDNANSPIPRSVSANPGIFLEVVDRSIESLTLTSGVRADVVSTEVIDDAARLAALGTGNPQSSLAEILGTNEFDQSFGLWSVFLTADYALTDQWTLHAAAGHGQRPPSLTELYAAESFMFLLQNGLNTVTGDPRLDPERRWQIDAGLGYRDDRFTARVNGFHAWVTDAITFENLEVRRAPPFGQIEQVNLKYVNTDLATYTGIELDTGYAVNDWLELFGVLSYVEGRDHTRNGDFATQRADGANPSQRVPGMPRGNFSDSGVVVGDEEPLPQIPPLEVRMGTRINSRLVERPFFIELAARVVDNQDRVATSLLETPTPGFTVWDLRSVWNVRDNVTVLAGVENFTDKDYREHFDFRSMSPIGQAIRQPGINFYFGSELTY